MEATRAVSELVRCKNLFLEETVRFWRGQTSRNPRPIKALHALHLDWFLAGYPQRDQVLRTIDAGVTHAIQQRRSLSVDLQRSKNHKSAKVMENGLVRSIREGQDTGTYLLVDVDAAAHRTDIHVSPFGCVPKADADPAVEARVIHDLSFPSRLSVNDHSDPADLPVLVYQHVSAIARRIEALKAYDPSRVVKVMWGDAKSACRNLPGHPSTCA